MHLQIRNFSVWGRKEHLEVALFVGFWNWHVAQLVSITLSIVSLSRLKIRSVEQFEQMEEHEGKYFQNGNQQRILHMPRCHIEIVLWFTQNITLVEIQMWGSLKQTHNFFFSCSIHAVGHDEDGSGCTKLSNLSYLILVRRSALRSQDPSRSKNLQSPTEHIYSKLPEKIWRGTPPMRSKSCAISWRPSLCHSKRTLISESTADETISTYYFPYTTDLSGREPKSPEMTSMSWELQASNPLPAQEEPVDICSNPAMIAVFIRAQFIIFHLWRRQGGSYQLRDS